MARPCSPAARAQAKARSRRYVLENDLLEAIIGPPIDMFYNSGISPTIWILNNRKPIEGKGKLQLNEAFRF